MHICLGALLCHHDQLALGLQFDLGCTFGLLFRSQQVTRFQFDILEYGISRLAFLDCLLFRVHSRFQQLQHFLFRLQFTFRGQPFFLLHRDRLLRDLCSLELGRHACGHFRLRLLFDLDTQFDLFSHFAFFVRTRHGGALCIQFSGNSRLFLGQRQHLGTHAGIHRILGRILGRKLGVDHRHRLFLGFEPVLHGLRQQFFGVGFFLREHCRFAIHLRLLFQFPAHALFGGHSLFRLGQGLSFRFQFFAHRVGQAFFGFFLGVRRLRQFAFEFKPCLHFTGHFGFGAGTCLDLFGKLALVPHLALQNGSGMSFGTGAGLDCQLRLDLGFNASARFQYRFGLDRVFFATGGYQPDIFQC